MCTYILLRTYVLLHTTYVQLLCHTYMHYYSCIKFTDILLFLVPSEPYSFQVLSVTSSSVTLQWIPPKTPNGVITQYSIQYGGTVIDNFGSETSNKLMGTVEGLSPDATYTLQLRAHTKVGPGPPSSLTIKTCKFLYSKRFKS